MVRIAMQRYWKGFKDIGAGADVQYSLKIWQLERGT